MTFTVKKKKNQLLFSLKNTLVFQTVTGNQEKEDTVYANI